MQNDNNATFLQLTNTHIPELFGKQPFFVREAVNL